MSQTNMSLLHRSILEKHLYEHNPKYNNIIFVCLYFIIYSLYFKKSVTLTKIICFKKMSFLIFNVILTIYFQLYRPINILFTILKAWLLLWW